MVAGAEEIAAAIEESVKEAATDKPVLAVVISADGTPAALREEGAAVASFLYPESAARALGLAADRAEWLRRPAGALPALEGVDADAARRLVQTALEGSSDVWLDPARTRRLLEAYGVPLVPERLAETAEQAVEAARDLGFPSSSRRPRRACTRRRAAGSRSTSATRSRCARPPSGSAGR